MPVGEPCGADTGTLEMEVLGHRADNGGTEETLHPEAEVPFFRAPWRGWGRHPQETGGREVEPTGRGRCWDRAGAGALPHPGPRQSRATEGEVGSSCWARPHCAHSASFPADPGHQGGAGGRQRAKSTSTARCVQVVARLMKPQPNGVRASDSSRNGWRGGGRDRAVNGTGWCFWREPLSTHHLPL